MAISGKRAITTDAYRQAVSEIIENIRLAEGFSDRQLSEQLGCSASTIRNARHQSTSLDPAILIRIEQEFGPGGIDPFLALANVRALQLVQDGHQTNIVLAMVEALHRIVEAQSADSERGSRITATELRSILADLRKGRAALDTLIALADKTNA